MKKGFLGLEITSSRIRYTLATRKGRGLAILKTGSVPYKMNLASVADLTGTIKDILEKEQFSPKRVFLTVSRQDTLIRHIKLPHMTNRELEEVLKAEIEKIPAFLNNRFDFIFQKFKFSKERVSVVFAAIQQKSLSYILKGVQKLRVSFRHLEIAPLNLQRLMVLKKKGRDAQMILIVNDLVSYFILYKDSQYKLFYKTAIGIDHLYPDKNDQIEDRTLTTLTSELQRVLKSYQSENKEDEAVHDISLVWDKDGADGFEDSIREKMGLQVHVPSLKDFNTAVDIDPQHDNPIYVISCIPLFYFVAKAKAQFSFDHFFRAFHIKKYFIKAAVLTLIFVGVTGGLLGKAGFEYYNETKQMTRKTNVINSDIVQLRQESKDLYTQRESYVQARQGLLDQAAYVRTLNRVSWSQVLSVIAEDLPEELALTSFKFSETGGATFKGDALQVETISELIRRVEDSSILYGGRFDFLREKFVEEEKIFQFGIMAQLKKSEETKETKEGDAVKADIAKKESNEYKVD